MHIPKDFIAVLHDAADQLGNNSCNDFEVPNTPENFKFVQEMQGDEPSLSKDKKRIYCMDWEVLDHIANLLEKS